jgi:hypothetical protein
MKPMSFAGVGKIAAARSTRPALSTGNSKRKDTERTKWDEAKSIVSAWEEDGSWDGCAKVETPISSGPQRHPPDFSAHLQRGRRCHP